MTEIIQIIISYAGTGLFIILYAAALILLLMKEKDKGNRIMFGILPLVIAVLFILPPVYKIYSKIDGADTYYRLLWLIPMTATIIYSGLKFAGALIGVRKTLMIMAILIVLGGSSIYTKSTLVKAENRLHIPQDVIRVCDTIMNDTQGETAMAAMPSELLQFVRQYDSRIMMPYGREMLMPAYAEYYNPVYYRMEQEEVIDAAELAKAVKENYCSHVVINAARQMNGNLEEEGLELVSDLGAYRVYRNPDNDLMIFNN